MTKIVATIEARMASNRLPGKVLLPANGEPILAHLVGRIRAVPSVDEVVLATTTNPKDDCLEVFAQSHHLSVYRGSEENVMQRIIEAGEFSNADIIVEICGDCPVIDPLLIEQTIQLFLNNDCVYASNCKKPSYPIGMNTQVFYLNTLIQSYQMTNDRRDREHVTRHIHQNPEIFKQITLIASNDLYWPDLALTLDEDADYKLLKNIIEYFPDEPLASCRQIIDLMRYIHPEWQAINQHIRRKSLDE